MLDSLKSPRSQVSVKRGGNCHIGIFTGMTLLMGAAMAVLFGDSSAYLAIGGVKLRSIATVGLLLGLLGVTSFMMKYLFMRDEQELDVSLKQFLNGFCFGGIFATACVLFLRYA